MADILDDTEIVSINVKNIFGDSTEYVQATTTEGIIYGLKATMPENGQLTKMIVRLAANYTTIKLKGNIYDSSGYLVANAETEEITSVTFGTYWYELSFPNTPALISGQEYYICVWGELIPDPQYYLSILRSDPYQNPQGVWYRYYEYGQPWPEPYNPREHCPYDECERSMSIYCEYVPQ